MMGDLYKSVGGGAVLGMCAGIGLIVGVIGFGVVRDQTQRGLLASGTCTKITEAVYTPPPSAHTTCYGEGQQNCSTYFAQADPYLRSLWRCPKDGDQSGVTEFWRRTAEEFR